MNANMKSTGSKIKSFITHLKIYVEYYFMFISAIGILWGAFAVYDNWRDDNTQLKDDVKMIMVSQKNHAKSDSLLLINQESMQKQLDDIQLRTEENSDKLNSLEMSYIKYISNDKSLTKEDFLKYMNGLSYDAKKNFTALTGSQSIPSENE